MAVIYLDYLDESIELPEGETVVGRDVACALRFNDPAVSRRHLRLVRRGDQVLLEDLGSVNGTLRNGAPVVRQVAVRDGDIIALGARELRLRVASAPAAPGDARTLRVQDLAAFQRTGVHRLPATRTMAAVTPLVAVQRCPRCGAAVGGDAEACPACAHRWEVRPRTRTLRHAAASPPSDGPRALGRRRSHRRSVEVPLIYASSELEIEATTKDLSEAGVFVCTKILDTLGTMAQLTLLIDGGPSLRLEGCVRRVVTHATAEEEVGLGIEFVALSDAHRAWLRALLDREPTEPVETVPIDLVDL